MKRLVLLDSHAILHRAYHALPDFSTSKGEPTGALFGLSTMVIKIIEELKPDYVVACYDLKGPTFRHEVFKEYKDGRAKTDDELITQIIRSRDIFTALNIPIYDKEGFEADDMLGTIVEQVTEGNRVIGLQGSSKSQNTNKSQSDTTTLQPSHPTTLEIFIASGDMDTLQLVKGDEVKVYTLKKGIKDTIIYNEKAVIERFGFGPELIPDYKGLRGDPSDNIPGIKGIGEKTATILITTFGTIENMYKEMEAGHEDKFSKAGITPRIIQLIKDNKEEAEFSKMLATIRRDAPIKFEIPKKSFKDGLDIKKVTALMNTLEFRTLTQRFEKAAGITEGNRVTGLQGSSKSQNTNKSQSDTTTLQPSHPTTLEVEKTKIALWIVDSKYTNPSIEDIYNFANTEDFTEAQKNIYTELDKRNLRKVYEDIELPLIPIIQKMKEHGIKIDKILLEHLSKTYGAELARLEKSIWKQAGIEFNIASPKQLGEILFDKLGLQVKNAKKTAGGARSTKESELEKMRDMHPTVPMIFEYRELAKLLSTYIDAIPPLLDKENRLHGQFVQTGTTTGRMASIDPNLQNIPIKSDLGKKIRDAFVASKGFKLAAFDYSQMELRIAAFMSGDEKLIDIFRKGEDVHTAVASFVFKVPQDKVTSEMRRRAKVINFGIIYGMGVNALKANLGTDRAEAQTFYHEYFATYSTLANYLNKIKAETARKGYTDTFFGRRRYFEGINSKLPFIRAAAERMAINAPIQGTGADIIKLALINIVEYIKKEKLENDVFPLLQVHDELIFEIKADLVEKVSKKIKEIMQEVVNPEDIQGIKMIADSVIGDNWGELK